jgi:hypothetical protein
MLFVGCILCIVWLMLFVGWILCIVNVNRCAERTLRVCYRWGGFYVPFVDVIGWVDFMYRSSMLLVGWILYVPFGRCYRLSGFLMHRLVDVICRMHFMHR